MEKGDKIIDSHYLLWYLIIFSIIGLIIEEVFCYVTQGIIESRQGLLIGPFCPIYGVGACCLIAGLDRYKNSSIKIFVFGAILGGIVEYVLSFMLEAIYGARFWDYDYKEYNLNGRICLTFSIYWGILSLLIMKYVRPKLDKYIEQIPKTKRKIINILIFVFLIIDTLLTVWAVSAYQTRAENKYYGNEIILEDNLKEKIENNIFNDDVMMRVFPNLRTRDNEGNLIFIKDIILNQVIYKKTQ